MPLPIQFSREQIRTITRYSFYLLFLLAPVLNIFRFDLPNGHFIIFGQPWLLGLETSQYQCFDTSASGLNILLNFILPIILLLMLSALIAWKYGRIYCGWLCPHFSVVETINNMMQKHLNRVTLWEKASPATKKFIPWITVLGVCIIIAFVWAFTLLSYIFPPTAVALDLYYLKLSLGPSLFLLAATIVLTLDFFFARHLFCQYGCSVGIMQSLIWMSNSKAMVIGFDKSRAHLCQTCDNECDKACPMRLPVRSIKRAKFTCTQCGVCLTACDKVHENTAEERVINWVSNEKAIAVDRHAAAFNIKRLKKST